MKRFNVHGVCIPEEHYMVDTSSKIAQIAEMVRRGDYFTINRARQYGKTTTLAALEEKLKEEYTVISISFEEFDETVFASLPVFIDRFVSRCARRLKSQVSDDALKEWQTLNETMDFVLLGDKITDLCEASEKPVVLIIDEVDKTSSNQLFLDFLGMLRAKYLKRIREVTFQSVILAGVYDIKNIKLKLRPDEQRSYNSPWNIAASFDVDMSFSPDEIATMLTEYQDDHHGNKQSLFQGMDIGKVSNEIYSYTSGYPYLVSFICKIIDEDLDGDWSTSGVRTAVKRMLLTHNTLFDDIIKNLNRHDELYNLIYRMLVDGSSKQYNAYNSAIDLGMTFGLFKIGSRENMTVAVSNVIFETLIYDYLISEAEDRFSIEDKYTQKSQYIENGKLNMELVLMKFQELMKCEYRKSDGEFLEKQGRLLFLCFLKPIINGTGSYAVEGEARDNTRMDIQVFYGREEFIIELKIYHGAKMNDEAKKQIYGYLDSRNQSKGYLVI